MRAMRSEEFGMAERLSAVNRCGMTRQQRRREQRERARRVGSRVVWSGLAIALCAAMAAGPGLAQSGDKLQSGFENPPASARPRVWWHWMNGNITKEGIKLDLEWMHRVGIGGLPEL